MHIIGRTGYRFTGHGPGRDHADAQEGDDILFSKHVAILIFFMDD